MRKLIVGSVIAVVVAGMVPGEAGVRTVKRVSFRFEALAPCTLVCPDPSEAEGCVHSPESRVSASDLVVRVPRTANYMIVTVRPDLDWDLAICRGGKSLRHSFNGLEATEKIGMWVRPGYAYRIRGWQWADVSPAPVSVVFNRVTF